MLQLGLMPSHLSLRFLQIIHASRFGLGTLELSGAAGPTSSLSPFVLRGLLWLPEPAPFSGEPVMAMVFFAGCR